MKLAAHIRSVTACALLLAILWACMATPDLLAFAVAVPVWLIIAALAPAILHTARIQRYPSFISRECGASRAPPALFVI